MTTADLTDRLDHIESNLNSTDPYARAAAFAARSDFWVDAMAQVTDSVIRAGLMLASLQDRGTCARIRFANGIPTLTPKTEAAALGLLDGLCGECGRPWQTGTDGACPECPTLLWGPTPRTRSAASELPRPAPVRPQQLGDIGR